MDHDGSHPIPFIPPQLIMRNLCLALSIVAAVICSPASAQENLPIWTLREELRIGAVDGPAEPVNASETPRD